MVALSLDNLAVQTFIAYAAILAAKILVLSPITGLVRVIRGVYVSPEDVMTYGGKMKFDDPVIERIRRAHRNDLENIPAFWLLGLLYLTTGPAIAWANLLFRAFAISRIVHTVVYLIFPLPQPTRFLVFAVGLLVNLYMAWQVIQHYIVAI